MVRIGAFTAIADGGRYLTYLPGVRTLSVLARQPSSAMRERARGVEAGEERLRRAPRSIPRAES